MKNLMIYCLLSLLSFSASAQGKDIFGTIFYYDYGNFNVADGAPEWDTPEAGFYEIYLLSGTEPGAQSKMKAREKGAAVFKITLSEEELKQFKYIEFVGGKDSAEYYKTMQIAGIRNAESLTVLLNTEAISEVVKPFGKKLDRKSYVGKPAIYLYPEQTTKVSIKHEFKGPVLNTFPPYEKGWEVLAEPNGKLKNLVDGRNYAYLFWDGSTSFSKEHYNYKDGFYISRKDNIRFLQEHLSLLGLNETEINDFIVYWLPQLNKNEMNFIHFWVNDDIDHSSKLEVQPKPETMLRVFMEFEPYDGKKPMLPKQVLSPTPRKGFVLVEWGGGPIGSAMIE